jgi:hypothetical protein
MSDETDHNTLQWIATVDDSFDCDVMTEKIAALFHDGRRRLEDGMIEELNSDLDCFVHFEGSVDISNQVLDLEGVIDVDPNEEIIGFQNRPTWNLDRVDQEELPLDRKQFNPVFTGVGVDIHILDTGIFLDHNDFTGRAKYGSDFINENPKGDNHGHGTHCASTAAGIQFGIAKHANIYGDKVLSSGGSGSTSGVIKGIQAAANHGKKPAVLSLSLGGGRSTAMNKAVEDAAKENFVIVAAGNSAGDACNSSPASADGKVITVGSTDIRDSISSFSNRGKCVDIYAPGSNIFAASHKSKSGKTEMSGTSMATPHVAGLAAILLEKNNMDYESAYEELFALAVYGIIKGVGVNNLFMQLPTYTGPPTPPTMKPTMPPTFSPPQICYGNDKCTENFAHSLFGPQLDYEKPIKAEMVVPVSGFGEFCEGDNGNYKGKILLVRRGSCLFFEKVKNAQNQGAIGVFIALADKNDRIFPPAYYGNGKTKISSCMVDFKTGNDLARFSGTEVMWGVKELAGTLPPVTDPPEKPTPAPTNRPTKAPKSPKPTNQPTERPTRAPTEERDCHSIKFRKWCRAAPNCYWKKGRRRGCRWRDESTHAPTSS